MRYRFETLVEHNLMVPLLKTTKEAISHMGVSVSDLRAVCSTVSMHA